MGFSSLVGLSRLLQKTAISQAVVIIRNASGIEDGFLAILYITNHTLSRFLLYPFTIGLVFLLLIFT